MTKRRLRKERGRRLAVTFLAGALMLVCFTLFLLTVRNGMQVRQLSGEFCSLMLRQISPNLYREVAEEYYEDPEEDYETRTESSLTYESVLAQNVLDDAAQGADDGEADGATDGNGKKAAGESDGSDEDGNETVGEPDADNENGKGTAGGENETETAAASASISPEKLADYDYLVQNFYTVDSSTTISSAQLNASELLQIDCTVAEGSGEEPQILIYHTHASEGYSDSTEGDYSTTVVGVGEELAGILRDTYGYTVLHDTGVYDSDRNRAYSVAKPYIEQILAEYPSIEVVIDLHRDGVSSDTRLVTEQDGVSMAQVMFFNGLSRTTSLGDISYLENPYITENLAFSLQMKLAAEELYPGFSRKIYLKGYRYNMHLMPKSLLVEVGAQTNTLEEAMNAMGPLAAVLDQVLSGR